MPGMDKYSVMYFGQKEEVQALLFYKLIMLSH